MKKLPIGPFSQIRSHINAAGHWVLHTHTSGQVREKTAYSQYISLLCTIIKITIHLAYCDPKLVYNNNTKINHTLKDCVVFS